MHVGARLQIDEDRVEETTESPKSRPIRIDFVTSGSLLGA